MTPLPTPPQRADSATFAARGDTFLAALPAFVTEANLLQADVTAQAAAASTAAGARDVALASANYKGLWTALTGALNIPASVYHLGNFWVLTSNLANVTTQEPGTGSVWAPANGFVTPLPKVRPTLLMDFAASQCMDPRMAFGRGSTAMRVNPRGDLESVLSGVPRIDYDPITLACRGLLLEVGSTNLLLWSEQFDNAAYSKVRATVTANATTAPDGTQTADRLVEDATATNDHYLAQGFSSFNAGQIYTKSVWAKADTRSRLQMWIPGNVFTDTLVRTADFDLAAGTVPVMSGGGVSATITPFKNGWYRCTMAFSASVTVATNVLLRLHNGTDTFYTGNGSSGLYLWGYQMEVGGIATSYIPTTTAQVTRAVDSATLSGANFTSWFRSDEGTLMATHAVAAAGLPLVDQRMVQIDDASQNNTVYLRGYQFNGAGIFDGGVSSGGVVQQSSTQAPIAPNIVVSQAIAFKLNDVAYSRNGAAAEIDNVASLPIGMNTLRLGALASGVNGSQHLRRVAFYPQRLSNAQLQALTAQ
jgi:hypothetical protein